MNRKEAEEYLLNIPRFAKKTTHENLRGYLKLLGNPQDRIPAVHVAGTNGKGSVCAFLTAILEQKDCRVGVFTSPHLVRMNERFRIGRTVISDEDFERAFGQVYEVVRIGMEQGLIHPNFFEFLFMMAACYYAESKVDLVIYETGLGGRLDATNVLQPVLTVITSIGMDHMEYLGDTIEKIAGEKAGIIKTGVPCVYLDRPEEAAQVIEQVGDRMHAPLIRVEKERITIKEIGEETIDFSYGSQYDREYRIPKTALYQTENAMLAVRAAEYLLRQGAGPDAEAEIQDVIRTGLQVMKWAGRMEELEPGIYVDGAHNEPAIRAFCDTVSGLYADKDIILVFAVASDKQYNKMIHILCGSLPLQQVIVTSIGGKRATPLEIVEEEFKRNTEAVVRTIPEPEQALKAAGQLLTGHSRVFCVGSLYLVGELEAEKED